MMLRPMFNWFILMCTIYTVIGQRESLQILQSNSECFGSDVKVECSCDDGDHILLDNIYLGSKPLRTGCPASWNNSLNISDTCCEPDEDDCFYAADKNNYEPLFRLCSGRDSCQLDVYNDSITLEKCLSANISKFLQNTNYMLLRYFCFEGNRTFAIGDSNVTATRFNATVYAMKAQSPYPDTSYTFSVQSSDPNDTFIIYRITLDVPCNTTVQVMDRQRSEVANWTCDDNSYKIEELNVSSSYIEVEIHNDNSLEDARFWFGFQVSSQSNVTITHSVPERTTTLAPANMSTGVSNTSTTNAPANMSTDVTNSTTTTAPDGTDNFLRNIILSVSIPFVVIFCLLVVVTLCAMHRIQKRESVDDDRRISDEMEKYFVVSTEYTTVKTGPVMNEAPAEMPDAPPACRYSNEMDTANHQEATPQKKVEMTTEI